MAKKAVATFAAKTGAYVFTEHLVEEAKAKEYFEKK